MNSYFKGTLPIQAPDEIGEVENYFTWEKSATEEYCKKQSNYQIFAFLLLYVLFSISMLLIFYALADLNLLVSIFISLGISYLIFLLFYYDSKSLFNYKAEVERYEDKITHLFLGERGFAIFQVGKYKKEVYSDVCLYENCVYTYEEKDEVTRKNQLNPNLRICNFLCDGKKYQYAYPLTDIYGVDAKTHTKAIKELMNKISIHKKAREKKSLSATLYKNVSVNKEIIHIDKEKYEVIGESRTHYLYRKFCYGETFKNYCFLLPFSIIFILILFPKAIKVIYNIGEIDDFDTVIGVFFMSLLAIICSIYISYKIHSSHNNKYLLFLGNKGFFIQYFEGKYLSNEFIATYDSLTGYHLEDTKDIHYIELRKGDKYCVIEVNYKSKKGTEESIFRTLQRKLDDYHVTRQ